MSDDTREAVLVEPESKALAVVEHDLRISRAPKVVLEEARTAAKALTDVIKAKPRQVKFNGETYLEYEDWQTVGRFYGITAKVESTTFVEFGDVKGFEARAIALRADGMAVSAAEALCLNDEPNWAKKPLFQLKSMAQTRAAAKALRNCLAWVVVLAGYKPTPAEEMDGVFKAPPARPVKDGVQGEQAHPPVESRREAPAGSAGDSPRPYPPGSYYVRRIAEPGGKSKRYTIDFDTPHGEDVRVHCFADRAELLNTLEEAQQQHRPVFIRYDEHEKYGKNLKSVTLAPLDAIVDDEARSVANTPSTAYEEPPLTDADIPFLWLLPLMLPMCLGLSHVL